MTRIEAFVDFMGSFGSEPDEEYNYIKEMMEEVVGKNFSFKAGVLPHELKNRHIDIYIIDFGGILPGGEMTIISNLRSLSEQIEDHPNTLFIIWTEMTFDWYKKAIENYHQSLRKPNVIIRGYDGKWIEEARAWVNIKEPK